MDTSCRSELFCQLCFQTSLIGGFLMGIMGSVVLPRESRSAQYGISSLNDVRAHTCFSIRTSRTWQVCSIRISGGYEGIHTHSGGTVRSLRALTCGQEDLWRTHSEQKSGERGKIPKLQTHLTSQTAVRKGSGERWHYAFRDAFRRPRYWRIGPCPSLDSPRCGESSCN